MSTLLEVKDLTVRYGSSDFLAADSVSFQVSPGEVLGIVGESGSGKTTVGLAVLGLLPASARVSGSVLFEGNDLIWTGRTGARWDHASIQSMVSGELPVHVFFRLSDRLVLVAGGVVYRVVP